jgi:hypothetical protein
MKLGGLKRGGLRGPLAGSVALLAMSPAWASTININTILTNPSFETGTTGWNFTNGINPASVYVPTSTQYTPGSDGLPGSALAPDGTHVAALPQTNLASGAAEIFQITSVTGTATTTYTLQFWLGVPLGFTAPTVSLLFGEGVAGNVVQDGLPNAIQLTGSQLPTPGHWVLDTVSITTPSGGEFTSHPIGIAFFETSNGASNNQQIDVDIAAAPVPGPIAGAGFPGLILAASAFIGWRRKRRRSEC